MLALFASHAFAEERIGERCIHSGTPHAIDLHCPNTWWRGIAIVRATSGQHRSGTQYDSDYMYGTLHHFFLLLWPVRTAPDAQDGPVLGDNGFIERNHDREDIEPIKIVHRGTAIRCRCELRDELRRSFVIEERTTRRIALQ